MPLDNPLLKKHFLFQICVYFIFIIFWRKEKEKTKAEYELQRSSSSLKLCFSSALLKGGFS